jgi:hypothetical protein
VLLENVAAAVHPTVDPTNAARIAAFAGAQRTEPSLRPDDAGRFGRVDGLALGEFDADSELTPGRVATKHRLGFQAAPDRLLRTADGLAEQIFRTAAPSKQLSPYSERGRRAGGAGRCT